jgi:hypothetical protein
MEDEKFLEYTRSLDDSGIYRIVDEDGEPIMYTSQTGAFWKSYFLPKE